MTIQGQCQCGAIKFSVETPTKWCAHCHCSMCQKAHGAAFVTWFGVQLSQFKVKSKTGSLKWFHSSKQAQRGFCQHCGSTLFFQSTQWPDEMHIALANLTDKLDRTPAAHVYYESHVDWLRINDGLNTIESDSKKG